MSSGSGSQPRNFNFNKLHMDLFGNTSGNCRVCGRPLTDPESIELGIGPVCRTNKGDAPDELEEKNFSDIHFGDNPKLDGHLYLSRQHGDVVTNVPHLVVSHSPTGFEYGYGGSGPADLALNLAEHVLLAEGFQGERTKCFRGECFSMSYLIHQEVKSRIIAAADRKKGHKIPYKNIKGTILQLIKNNSGYGSIGE